jgi:hypothetical protein
MTLASAASANPASPYISADKLRSSVDRLKGIVLQNISKPTALRLVANTPVRSDLWRIYDPGHQSDEQVIDRIVEERYSKLLRSALRRPEIEKTVLAGAPELTVVGMQKWEGRVIEVDDDYFSAELVPFSVGPVVIADFARDLIDEEDDLQPGDVVYVTARTVQGENGATHTSAIRRRRLGRWTEAEIADQARRAKEQAEELAAYIE